MNIAFCVGRMICLFADVLSWPGERLFWLGDRICFNALYGNTEQEGECETCNGDGYTWGCDGYGAWQEECKDCPHSRQ